MGNTQHNLVVKGIFCKFCASFFHMRAFVVLAHGCKNREQRSRKPGHTVEKHFSQLLFYFGYLLLCVPRNSLEHNNWIFVQKEGITTVWFLKRTEDPTTHVSDTALLSSACFRFVESGLGSVKATRYFKHTSRDSHIKNSVDIQHTLQAQVQFFAWNSRAFKRPFCVKWVVSCVAFCWS